MDILTKMKGALNQGTRHLPMLNYLYAESKKPYYQQYYQQQRKKRMMNLVLRSPEVISILDAHARDIVGNFYFEPINNYYSGKTLLQRAERFAVTNQFKKIMTNVIMDTLITGEGYMFKEKLTKEMLSKLDGLIKDAIEAGEIDEDYFAMRKLRFIASTSMSITFDDYDIVGYRQQRYGVSDVYLDFPMDEIIRLSFLEMDGKVEGFTPLYTIPIHLELLWLLWSNQYDLQANGNHPDLVVMAEGLDSNKPQYKQVEQQLSAYNTPGNSKHGTMLLSGGKFTMQQLERMDTLQFKEVGMFIQTLIASLFQFPLSRVGIKTKEAASTSDSAGDADKGYWTGVEQKQDLWRTIMNTQLWEPFFGVRLVHDKSYKHDKVLEGNAQQLRLNNAKLLGDILRGRGQQLSEEAILKTYNDETNLDITPDDLEELDMSGDAMQIDMTVASTLNNQPSSAMRNGKLNDTGRSKKRAEEITRERNKGKPNGISR